MKQLNLTANGKSQERILAYLKENVSDILANKINNGVQIEKDGYKLINKKTLDGFMKYACDEAKKLAEKGANSACVEDSVVYGWAIHYFEEDSIEEKLFNLDGTEYKPIVKAKSTQKPTYTPTSSTTIKKQEPQISLFDMITGEDKKEKKLKTEKPTLDEILDYNIDEEHDDDEEEEDETWEEEIIKIEEEQNEPKRKISPFYQSYLDLQNKYPNHVICYRLGDFYEVFGKKAVQVSNKLDLTLTGRDCGLKQRVEMVGFPYHASDTYFKKILAFSPIVIYESNDVKVLNQQENSFIDIETGEILENDLKNEKALKNAFDKDVLYKIIDLFGDIITIE